MTRIFSPLFLFFGNLAPSLFNSLLSDPDAEQPKLCEFHTPQVLSQLFPLAVDAWSRRTVLP